jgi:hypothetical protein
MRSPRPVNRVGTPSPLDTPREMITLRHCFQISYGDRHPRCRAVPGLRQPREIPNLERLSSGGIRDRPSPGDREAAHPPRSRAPRHWDAYPARSRDFGPWKLPERSPSGRHSEPTSRRGSPKAGDGAFRNRNVKGRDRGGGYETSGRQRGPRAELANRPRDRPRGLCRAKKRLTNPHAME